MIEAVVPKSEIPSVVIKTSEKWKLAKSGFNLPGLWKLIFVRVPRNGNIGQVINIVVMWSGEIWIFKYHTMPTNTIENKKENFGTVLNTWQLAKVPNCALRF